jgi:spatacsin
MPFEMVVRTHEDARKVDLREINEPLVRFIWDLWVNNDPPAPTASCM